MRKTAYIDLVGLDEDTAKTKLLEGFMKIETPDYRATTPCSVEQQPAFPGSQPHFGEVPKGGAGQPDVPAFDDSSSSNEPEELMDIESGRRFLREVLPEITSRYRSKKKICVVVLDIDKLTAINNHYGMQVGDEVLGAVADVVSKTSYVGYSGRCGDDTFYAVLPKTDIRMARSLANKIRDQIHHQYQWEKLAATLWVTCSFGVAQFHPSEPVEDCIIRAIIGMFEAKRSGGNRVELGPKFLPKGMSRKLRDHISP